MTSKYLASILACGASLFSLAPGAAFSQDGDAASRGGRDVIVVTAQKREESIQDVPVSVTAIGEETLKNSRIETGTEIARQTPNLRVSLLGDESQPKFVIRGISTPEFNLNAISPTGVFFDEVYIGASFLGGAQIFDIERVEVLRGPQGTLYGKNTTAGAINFISKRPTFEPEAEIRAGYGSENYNEVQGVFELPIVEDRLSIRAAFNHAHSDGYIENLNPDGNDLSNVDRLAGRLSIGYKDDNGFDATLRGVVVHNNAAAIGAINEGLGLGGLNGAGLDPRVNPFTSDPLTRKQVVTDRSGVIEVRGAGGYLTMNKDLGFATLTSITSYFDGRFLNLVDGDGTIANLLHIDFATETEEFSQDLRLSSNGDGPFQWIVGSYHQRDDADISTRYRLFDAMVPTLPELLQAYSQERRSYALYVDGSYDLTDIFSIYGGARYTWDKGRVFDYSLTPVYPALAGEPSYDDGEPTGRIGLKAKVAPNILLYAQYARGYRSSAINGGLVFDPAGVNVADPEKLNSYEGGVKSQFFDGALTLNASGFYYKFRNQQFINVVSITLQELVNAGRSQVYGLELEAIWRPTDYLRLSGGLGLLESEYQELLISGVDLSGNELIEAPSYTFNIAADYEVPLGNAGSFLIHADVNGADSQFFQATNAPEFLADSFVEANARVAWRDPSNRYEIAAYVKNLNDNDVETGIQTDPTTLTRFTTVPYPRRWGVEVSARF